MIIHHFARKRLVTAFFAPECSVPAMGCPGTKLNLFPFRANVSFENIFFTEPTSEIIWFLLEKLAITFIILSTELTGVQMKIIELDLILASIDSLASSIILRFIASSKFFFDESIPTILLEIFFDLC